MHVARVERGAVRARHDGRAAVVAVVVEDLEEDLDGVAERRVQRRGGVVAVPQRVGLGGAGHGARLDRHHLDVIADRRLQRLHDPRVLEQGAVALRVRLDRARDVKVAGVVPALALGLLQVGLPLPPLRRLRLSERALEVAQRLAREEGGQQRDAVLGEALERELLVGGLDRRRLLDAVRSCCDGRGLQVPRDGAHAIGRHGWHQAKKPRHHVSPRRASYRPLHDRPLHLINSTKIRSNGFSPKRPGLRACRRR